MRNKLLPIACLFAGLAVVFGAFGAHGLQDKLPIDKLATFETAVRYQFYHAIAIFAAVILSKSYSKKLSTWAGIAFILGIICFSGSLYLLSCRELIGLVNYKWLGPITPIGGLFFIVGWTMLFVATLKKID